MIKQCLLGACCWIPFSYLVMVMETREHQTINHCVLLVITSQIFFSKILFFMVFLSLSSYTVFFWEPPWCLLLDILPNLAMVRETWENQTLNHCVLLVITSQIIFSESFFMAFPFIIFLHSVFLSQLCVCCWISFAYLAMVMGTREHHTINHCVLLVIASQIFFSEIFFPWLFIHYLLTHCFF